MQPQTFIFFGIAGLWKRNQVELSIDVLKKHDGRECFLPLPATSSESL